MAASIGYKKQDKLAEVNVVVQFVGGPRIEIVFDIERNFMGVRYVLDESEV